MGLLKTRLQGAAVHFAGVRCTAHGFGIWNVQTAHENA